MHANLSRRDLIAAASASAVGAFRPARPAEPADLFEVPGPGFYTIAGGKPRPVPRWEVPSVVAQPQPMPLATLVDGTPDNLADLIPDAPPEGGMLIGREWAEGAPDHCRLCATCVAATAPDTGRPTCVVLAIGREDLTVEEARTYSGREHPVQPMTSRYMTFAIERDYHLEGDGNLDD